MIPKRNAPSITSESIFVNPASALRSHHSASWRGYIPCLLSGLARDTKVDSQDCSPTLLMLCCGIDLGMRPKTTMAFLSVKAGKFTLHDEVRRGLSDEDIEALVWEKRPAVVAIDAPLSTSMEKPRPAEKVLRHLLRGCSTEFETEGSIGSPFGMMIFGITYRGRYLRQRLQAVTDVIETHPLVDYAFLLGDKLVADTLRKRKKNNTVLRGILEQYVTNLPAGLDDDQYDAVIAAMVACCYMQENSPIPLTLLPKQYNTDAEFVVFASQTL